MPVTPEIGVDRVTSLYLPTPIAYDLANSLGSHDILTFRGLRLHYCFGSSVSLSTLRPCRYLQTRKTRYAVGLVPLVAAGLSPARWTPLILAPWLSTN